MKTLKIVMLMILLSLFMTSCTDLINSDDQVIMDNIENTNVDSTYNTGGNSSNNSGGGKGGDGNG